MEPSKLENPSLKLRIIVLFTMLALAFIGVFITDIKKDGAWQYWRVLAILYAIIALGLSWHLHRKGWRTAFTTIWHELAHWVGLIGAVLICSYFVKIGLIGRFEASLVTLLLLALATYLAGVYIEPTFVILGIVLGGLAAGIAFIDTFVYSILLPVAIIAAVILIVYLYRSRKKPEPQ